MVASFNAVKFIESNVELDSYSSSKGFLGYCNSKVGWGDQRCIDAFIEMLALFVPKEIVVSSIRIHGDLQEHAETYELNEDDIQVRYRLLEQGLILNVASDEENESFHFEGTVSNSVLRDFVLYQSSIGELSYHGFITNSESEFIIYPHDDCGLGFIISDETKKKLYSSKLQECAERYSEILEFKLNE